VPRLIAAVTIVMALGAAQNPPAAAVPLVVRFRLTDLDEKPLPKVPVRIAFGSDKTWQQAGAGHRFVTDANGAHTFTASVELDRQMKKVPTNYKDSLTSVPVPMDHLLVATELEYAGLPWLYATDIFHIPPGDTLLDGRKVWIRDERGNFTRQPRQDRDGLHLPEMGGLVLTGFGHDVTRFALKPDENDPSRGRWTLDLSFKQQPAPIRR
jgi:hypothetical protein